MTEDEFRAHVAGKIKEARKNNGESQQDLADIVGCSRKKISQIESEQTSISAYLLYKITLYYNIDIDSVFHEIDGLYEDKKKRKKMERYRKLYND